VYIRALPVMMVLRVELLPLSSPEKVRVFVPKRAKVLGSAELRMSYSPSPMSIVCQVRAALMAERRLK
jgi:hypothetical protein